MRLLFRLIGVLVVFLLVAVAGLLLLPGDRIAQVAVDQIRTQTGRDVTLKGETRISYYPVLGVSTGALEIANADWSNNGPFLSADSLKVGVDFTALLSGDIRIVGLEAVNPAILLERARDGRANWEIGVDGVSASGQGASASDNALALSLDRALISGGSLRYLDHQSGLDQKVTDLTLDLSWPVYRGKAEFSLSGQLQGLAPLRLDGEIADLAALIEGEITQGVAKARFAGAQMGFTGRFGLPAQAQGRLDLTVPDSAALLAGLGSPGVQLPHGLGQKLELGGELTLTSEQLLSLRGLKAKLDHNGLAGDLDVNLALPVPQVTARLTTGMLDLSALSGGESGTSPSQVGWSKAPIDASALALFNGQLRLDLDGMKVAGLTFGKATLQLTNDNARAVAKLASMQGYGGAFSGQVVANNRKGLSVGGEVQASGVELQGLLRDLLGVERFTGQAELAVNFLAVGNSLDAIMRSLSGEGRLSMGRGTIQGIDLDSLMRSGTVSGGTTVFDSLGASFTMDKGDLHNRDLLLKLPIVSASGAGRVGLGQQDIDYTFIPKAGAADQGGIAIPVRIKGPWSGPKIWPDLEKAVDLNLKKEKEAAKKELESKVKKELGITEKEGENLEDAAKRKLEEELLKGLGKLLR